MHGAPSVSYPVGRSRMARRVLLVHWICGACCTAAACWHLGKVDWRSGVLVLGLLGAGMAARASALRRTAPTLLNFDGLGWSMTGPAGLQAGQARVALDTQSSLLVRLAGPRRTSCWIWLERHAMPERWQDLRRALYSRAVPAGQALASGRASASTGAHHSFP